MAEQIPVRTVDLVIADAAELLTCAPDATDLIGCVRGGGLAVDDGRIVAVGDVSGYRGRRRIDASGKVVMPGFVDSHTHVVFGGDRAAEYAGKVAGAPPPEGAAVGITGTMADTRALSAEELVDQALPRVRQMLAAGTTTFESKTGYGLSREAEWRLLEANARLASAVDARLVSTYLGGHAIAPGRDPEQWTAEIVAQLPEVAAAGLAAFNDVYCDEGYFTPAQTERILAAGLEHGLVPKIHLDAYSHTGVAPLAARLGAVSADHLNYTTDAELEQLAEAGVTGVYMPCLEYAVAHPRPLDPTRLQRAGMEVALATDVCPGCWTIGMETVIVMACRAGGMSVPAAIRAATRGGALALGLGERVGSLTVGRDADVLVLDVPSHEHLAYRLSGSPVDAVVRAGAVVSGARTPAEELSDKESRP
ncbi:imidazolonepropionase [Kocuria marina]|uniref:imidazolonepropionase n=1 Tax=Kocuria marina TaxID=223184 RepID=UPI0022DF4AD8|nr:imidazolonepropionase [Kocuria marina]